MNETTWGSTPTSDLPPILPPQQATFATSPHAGPSGTTGGRGRLEPLYAALRSLPARRSDGAVLGGVCATLAERLGVSPVAVRLAAVLSVLFLGVGAGLYVLAWTLMPDGTGRTHLEEALRHGRARSLMVLVLGTFAAIGVVTGALSFLVSILPQLLAVAALGAVGWWAWGRMTRTA